MRLPTENGSTPWLASQNESGRFGIFVWHNSVPFFPFKIGKIAHKKRQE
jgi:hypothetical protein